jgi:site-specific recombinase XerD
MTDFSTSWARSLRARNRSPNTIDSYLLCVRLLDEYLGLDACEIRREHVEAFIADQLATRSVATAGIRYRSLYQFFNWLVDEDEIETHPMSRMSAPVAPEVPIPVVDDEALRQLLRAAEGKTFEDRRDSAILRLFVDTPCRISEVTNLAVSDVNFERCEITVIQKGAKEAAKPFGPKSLLALDRYVRVRGAHNHASSARLWLGPRGPLTRSGVAQMLKRRCTQAGLAPIHAHQFRHTWAHNWKAEGGRDEDLMQLAGWNSPAMLRRYGASLAAERARDAYRQRLPGERL